MLHRFDTVACQVGRHSRARDGRDALDPRGGFEPPLTDSESAVLPLDDRGSRAAR